MHLPRVAAADFLHPSIRLPLRRCQLLLPRQWHARLIHGRQFELPALPYRRGFLHLLGDRCHLRLSVKNIQPLQ